VVKVEMALMEINFNRVENQTLVKVNFKLKKMYSLERPKGTKGK
jgi:hypothetical protein